MSAYNIVVDGKQYKVEVEKKSLLSFTVKMNDKAYVVEVSEKPDFGLSIQVKVDGKSYTVSLGKAEKALPISVTVNDTTFKAEAKTLLSALAVAGRKTAEFAPVKTLSVKAGLRKPLPRAVVEEGVVTAPMTGKIVKVKVRQGGKVKEGDIVCVLEAMKMENEIAAPKGGVVKEVHVSEGTPVSEGDVLVEIE